MCASRLIRICWSLQHLHLHSLLLSLLLLSLLLLSISLLRSLLQPSLVLVLLAAIVYKLSVLKGRCHQVWYMQRWLFHESLTKSLVLCPRELYFLAFSAALQLGMQPS